MRRILRIFANAGMLLCLPAAMHATLIIDDFSINFSATTSNASNGNTATRTARTSTTGTFGGITADREILAFRGGTGTGQNGTTVSMIANSGVLNLSASATTTRRVGELVYEASGASVIDAFGDNPDVYTLGWNLSGNGTDFQVEGSAAVANTPVYVTLYGANDLNSASATFFLTTTNTTHTIALSSFAVTGTVDFSNIRAMRVLLGTNSTSVTTNTANISLDALRIVGAVPPPPTSVPEPATMGLMGISLLGVGLMKRRFRS